MPKKQNGSEINSNTVIEPRLFLLCHTITPACVRLIADIYAHAGVHSNDRHREGQCFGNRDCSFSVIMGGEALYPCPINFLSLIGFDILNQTHFLFFLIYFIGRFLPSL